MSFLVGMTFQFETMCFDPDTGGVVLAWDVGSRKRDLS
jgi:hypothetical protein